MKFKGIIIEESLMDKSILNEVVIVETKVEKVSGAHNTPWLSQWTMHTVEIQETEINRISEKVSVSFDPIHSEWYADFKNELFHFIVFPEKVFRIARMTPDAYQVAVDFGKSIGIPEHQLDFSPAIEEWKLNKHE